MLCAGYAASCERGQPKSRASRWSARIATSASPPSRSTAARAARYLGFKCPHCKLFVPLQRATDAGMSRDPEAAS